MSSTLPLPLPEDKLPECWKDEARMNVLFAPVRDRAVNPQDWNSKLTFWSELINLYCVHNQVYSFTLSDLNNIFVRNGRSPNCLKAIIDEMFKMGKLKTAEDFFQESTKTWSRWATNILLKKPVIWSFRKIKSTLVLSNEETVYVHVGAVSAGAEKLLSAIPDNYKNKIITLEDLMKVTGYNENNVENFKMLLHHLANKGNVDIRETPKHNLQEQSKLTQCLLKIDNTTVKPIDEVDVGIHTLEQSEEMLLKNIEKLENESFNLIEEAKTYLKKGHKQMARSCLRKKREVEKTILKRANALSNVQTLLNHVRDVDDDDIIYDTYKKALSSLQRALKEKNLTEDLVTDTMVDLGELLDKHNDIQTALSQSVTGNDSDLEEELEELIKSDSNTSTPTLPTMPTPPKSSIENQDELLERLNSLRFDPAPVDKSTISNKSKVSL